jgi:hypothetical protein
MKMILVLISFLLPQISIAQTAWHNYVNSQSQISSKILNSANALSSDHSKVIALLDYREGIFAKVLRPHLKPPLYSHSLLEAVSYYSIWYDKINTPLRKGQLPKGEALKFYKSLTSVDFENLISAVGVVFRGVNLPRLVYQGLERSKSFKDLAIMSASLRPVGAKAYIENCVSSPANECVFMILNSKRSKYISYLSDLPKEEEVLFRPGTNFRVKRILKELGRGFVIVYLDEL